MRSILRDLRLKMNPDLRWVGQNLAPRMAVDADMIAGGLPGRPGTARAFLFDGRDIVMTMRWFEGVIWDVRLRQLDLPTLSLVFRVEHDRPRGGPVVMANGATDDVVAEVAARLRAFGEAYLAAPLSRFNYATPGEYVEWPDRSVVEPHRDPSARPIEEVDAELEPQRQALHGLAQSANTADRVAAAEEARRLQGIRYQELFKTTYGRWLARHKGMDLQFDAYVDRLARTGEGELRAEEDTDRPGM
ncbi:hypothetical protein LAZ40_04565 [Cereibacter sphaeroides]|uniref:hypothetical protein n=1 Tax=Cereibacter sphaeroides TaxID=1063 RepID=UPI001F19DA58|nr:hypothetical protein [Cereibacter sphaeroides]MCE6958329.1 hypothetical protein [Cereibacter sphaeroides]MCE6971153.1 hypothetical protein [Cereibacter sphaeroides]